MRGTLVLCPDLEALSREAARRILAAVVESSPSRRAPFRLALAGGSTPRRLYEVLASDEFRSRMPWPHIHLFWGDERLVPRDHPESNYRMVHEALLRRVTLPAENIHPVPILPAPEAAAEAYERDLRAHFGQRRGFPTFDLVLLGLGADGHTGSLFPGAATLEEKQRLAVAHAVGVGQLPRVTLTLPVFNHARRVYFLVAGEKKATALRIVLEESGNLPAQRVDPGRGQLIWLADSAAAGRLSRVRVLAPMASEAGS